MQSSIHSSWRSAAFVFAAVFAWGCALRTPDTSPSPLASCRSTPSASGAATELFHWIVASEQHESEAVNAWCAGVGAPVLLTATGSDRARADSILIITWNSNVGGGDLIGFVGDIRSGQLTGGTPVTQFVLLVQEAHRVGDVPAAEYRGVRYAYRLNHVPPGERERADVVEVAERLGLHLVYVPSMRNGRPRHDAAEDRGNAILSTVPLHEPAAIELPLERQRRVVAVATARGTTSDGHEWSLRLASVHLDNRSRPERLHAWFGAARMRQARALVEALDDGGATVIAGDLNNWSFAALEEAPAYLRSYFPDVEPDATRTLTMLGLVPRRLDHIMARLPEGTARAGSPVTVESRYGSDHHPVLGWLKLSGANEHPVAVHRSGDEGEASP